MSVLLVTSLGDIVVDLFVDKCPLTTKNFLKLCKIKYYNGCLFHTVQKDFTAQTGDPTGTGTGGDSVYKFLYGDQARFFGDEIHVDLKHRKTGTVAMASAGENINASQFYITLRDDLDYLDGKHTVFGEMAEGHETLSRINEAYVDDKNRPYKNIRIKHTYILDDPFDDPPQLSELIPDASPEGKPKDEVDDEVRLEDDWVPLDEQLGQEELEEVIRSKEALSSAVVLEAVGDIPDFEAKPPDNVLFVCKLNPVTEDEDLHTIFSRFGTVTSAEVIRDYKTGDSLCYAFIEFEDKEACEQAYFKMDNALIDDRRIHVDFSQSVAKLWSQFRKKSNHKGGCFKCGAIDHIAKDCTGAGPPKYILKEDNRQHGGYSDSRYDMVFDGDTSENPKQGKRHRIHDHPDSRVEKSKLNRKSSDRKERDRDQERKSEETRNHRDERDHRRRSLEMDCHRERRDDREHRKRSADDDRHGEKRDYGDYRRRNRDIDSRDRRDEEYYRKRSGDRDDREYRKNNERREMEKESSYRKGRDDDGGYKGRKPEREVRRHGAEIDDERNQRHHRADRRR